MLELRRSSVVMVSVLIAFSGLDLLSVRTASATTCGTTLPLAVPSCGVLWGISTPGGSAAKLRADESSMGRRFDLTYHFHRIGDLVPNADERTELAGGRKLHINIESAGYSYAAIARGAADVGLAAQARGVSSISSPVYVTFEHEPDVKTKVSRGTPAEFVAAWRHVHSLFRAKGAGNAVWVWVTTGWYPNFPRYAALYPGNDVVDWISWEAYSTTACNATRNVLKGSFATSAGPMYAWLHDGRAAAAGIDVTKPEMISEYGAVYDNGNPGAQGNWYRGIPQLLKISYPDIKAVAKWDNPHGNCRYDMGVSTRTAAGVRDAGRDPYVNQLAPR